MALILFGSRSRAQIVAAAASTDDRVTSDLMGALVRAKSTDPKAVRRIGERLAKCKDEFSARYLVQLLRLISGNAMGPKDYAEYDGDPKGWIHKWVDWAKQH